MGCVLALCLPFDVKKSSWVTPLSEASVAPRGRQVPLGRRPWCRRRRRGSGRGAWCFSRPPGCPGRPRRRPRRSPRPIFALNKVRGHLDGLGTLSRRRSGRLRPQSQPHNVPEHITNLCYHFTLKNQNKNKL